MTEGISGPGFYPQPNEWTCGPFALKHALLALGRMVDAPQIAQAARTHWWSGTDEIQLARAAREFECDLVLERRSDPEQARRLLVDYLREQTPVLLCVDEWTHWITVVRAEDRRFVVVDSLSDPLLCLKTWPQLRKWWCYRDIYYSRENPPVLYDLMAVTPRFRTTIKADFSAERVKFLRRPENRRLAHHWNEYLEDLLEICKPPSVRIAQPLSMGEFLRRHAELLMTRVVYWHGDVNRDEISRILRELRFVSETYGLVIPASMSRRALADLSILIALWATADRGVDPMFGAPGAEAREVPDLPPPVLPHVNNKKKDEPEPKYPGRGSSKRHGRANGRTRARSKGRANGKSNGRANGKSNGRANGKSTGRANGKSNGRANGKSNGRH